jgi:flagellar motor switch protein FliN
MQESMSSETDGTMPIDAPDTAVTGGEPTVEVRSAQFGNLDASPGMESEKDKKLELLMDLTLPVAIELGRTNMLIRDILDLQRGSVVEFEKLASEPVDVLINGKKMAEGEVVVIEKHFGIRITNLVEASERVKALGR